MGDASSIALSLISHTNAGKTTLARTLLARDVGEVRDAPHVTLEATPYTLLDTPAGDALILWDTPGFGDSARLARRLAQQGNPVGWFLAQVWDRFRDRPFWLSQRAVANVQDRADVVLYLVNASEAPADAGYLASELAVLQWIGKPVIVLLNQTGPPRNHGAADESAADVVEATSALQRQEGAAEMTKLRRQDATTEIARELDAESDEEMRWRTAVAGCGCVSAVLTLDAFARCWVQEFTLFAAIGTTLPAAKSEAFARLNAAWFARRMAQFDEAMAVLALPIARAACDHVTLPAERLRDKLGRVVGLARDDEDSVQQRAMRTLAQRLDAEIPRSTEQLIAIYGLDGRAAVDVQARLASDVRTDAPMDEGKAAMVGGAVSGALSGLAADLAVGGLTFGAGMLAGAMLGALGGAGVARGVNLVRGKNEAIVRWDDAFLDGLVASTVLRYLAVAHYGRGRGEWKEAEYPKFWSELVRDAVAARRDALREAWAIRTGADDVDAMVSRLQPLLSDLTRALLDDLYPGTLVGVPSR